MNMRVMVMGSLLVAGASGCVMDSLVEQQESEMRAAASEIQMLETRLQSLSAQTRKLELQAGPDAIARRRKELEGDLAKFGLRVTSRGPELVVTLAGTVLFDPGRAQVRAEAKPVLLGLASAIAGRFPERSVRIEGHTDSTQPRRVVEEFPTNWELSAARSLAVLRFLIDDAKLPKERVIAAAFGEHRPVKDNASAEGREENRRVDIIIMPTVGVDRVETAGLLP